MKTISLKLPDELARRLEEAAGKHGQSKSALARAALEAYFAQQQIPPGSFLEAVGDLIGCVEGPGDLSTNPKHMEGFGE